MQTPISSFRSLLTLGVTVLTLCASATRAETLQTRTALRYDTDYPTVGYGEVAHQNDIARLQERLDRGELKLEFRPQRGYLDSILKALNIDPSSQTLVYSKTSLQIDAIRGGTPRAIYFNDDTYVAWVQHSSLLEFATMDASLGPVFYTLTNHEDSPVNFDRETLRCLACHDTFSLAGGGVPRFLFMSSLVNVNGEGLGNNVSQDTTDATPIPERWAGWYVTGQSGNEPHLGNLQLHSEADLHHLDRFRRENLTTLNGLFDTQPYMTDKSDIVALLVFEHQAYVHNFITRTSYKARTILARNEPAGANAHWSELSAKSQTALRAMINPMLRAMLFVNAAPLNAPVTSSSGFDAWFQRQGPRDPQGRSLRQLDLRTRVFRYPLSFLIYSEGFDALPIAAKEYFYTSLRETLRGEREMQGLTLSAETRAQLTEILTATKPEFVRLANADKRP